MKIICHQSQKATPMVTGARASRSPVLPHPVAFSRTRLLVHYMIIFGSQLLTLHSLWAGRVERLADGNCICAGPNQIRFTGDALVLGQDMTLKAHQSRMASRGYASAAETVAVITFESDRKIPKTYVRLCERLIPFSVRNFWGILSLVILILINLHQGI